MPSLFEEQLVHDQLELFEYYEGPAESSHEAQSYFPELDGYDPGPDAYLRTIEAAKQAVEIPIIGSLNGTSRGGWTRYARMIEEAGADALELNIYLVATDPDVSGGRRREAIRGARGVCPRIDRDPAGRQDRPVLQLAPQHGPASGVRRRRRAGPVQSLPPARHRPRDLDRDAKSRAEHQRRVASSLAMDRDPARPDRHFPGGDRPASISPEDVVKLLLAGADATMTASSLYKNGPGHIRTLIEGVGSWLGDREYASVEQMKGSVSRQNIRDPEAYERANYVKTLTTFIGGSIWGRPDRPR